MIRYISLLLAIISGQHTTFSESLELFKRQCHIRDATWDTALHYLLSDSLFFSGGPALQQEGWGGQISQSLSASGLALMDCGHWSPATCSHCLSTSELMETRSLSQKKAFTSQKGKCKTKIELLPWAGCAGPTVWLLGRVSDWPPC